MLEVTGLVCSAGGRRIVGPISTVFAPGLLHVIVGPNGSGKSTFMKAFSGDWLPESGIVRYDGEPVTGSDKAFFSLSSPQPTKPRTTTASAENFVIVLSIVCNPLNKG